VRRLIRESKAAIIKCDDTVPRGHERGQLIPPAIHRGANAVNEDDGCPAPGIDQPESRSIHCAVLGAEGCARGIALRFWNRRGATGTHEDDAPANECPGTHESVCNARRASRRMSGWEVHKPVTASPTPDVIT